MSNIQDLMISFDEVANTKLKTLRASQQRTDQKLAATDNRLKALVDVVERSISSGRKSTSKTSAKKPGDRSSKK